ncbi:MAG: glycosyltransferase, partial [Bacteroidaceae bacterium]|nr:glycosyltransferase [Bacteroidaceae bacterium]
MKKNVSILIPCYNEEKSLPLMYQALCDLASLPELSERYDWEWLFINDGSVDHTLDILQELRQRD